MQLLPMTPRSTTADQALLSRTRVASPCRADWDTMIGDDRSRFCGSCRKNVYNLSAMTAAQAAALIREKEGKLCVRYFERADGTVLTQDCPVGVAAVRRRMARTVAAGIVGFAALFSAATQWWVTDTGENLFAVRLRYWAEKIHPITEPELPALGGAVAVDVSDTPVKIEEPQAIMGEAPPQDYLPKMGKPTVIMGRPRLAPDNNQNR